MYRLICSLFSTTLLGLAVVLAGLISPCQCASDPGPDLQSAPTAYLFLSPNTDEDLSLEEALRRLASPRQDHFRALAGNLLRQAGVRDIQVHDAIGDWSEGAENSLLAVVPASVEMSTLQHAAARFGLLASQKGVLVFRPEVGGHDDLAILDFPDRDVASLRSRLDLCSIRERTILPTHDGQRVVVLDMGRKLHVNLERLGRLYGSRVHRLQGTGVFIGEETRERAGEMFRRVIMASNQGWAN